MLGGPGAGKGTQCANIVKVCADLLTQFLLCFVASVRICEQKKYRAPFTRTRIEIFFRRNICIVADFQLFGCDEGCCRSTKWRLLISQCICMFHHTISHRCCFCIVGVWMVPSFCRRFASGGAGYRLAGRGTHQHMYGPPAYVAGVVTLLPLQIDV